MQVGNGTGSVRSFGTEPCRIPEGGWSMETLKNNANRIVGTKQVLRAVKAGKLQRIYVANDVDTFLYQQVIRAAEAAEVPVTRVESMKELGEACGVQVAAAAAGIVKE